MIDPATQPSPPVNRIFQPTRLAEKTVMGMLASVSALVALIICVLAWHNWQPSTEGARIDWLGRIGMALITTLWLLGLYFIRPRNGSIEASGPGVDFKISDGSAKGGTDVRQ